MNNGSNLRPCIIDDKQKAFFHCWTNRREIVPPSPMIGGHCGGVIEYCKGIVELEDGTIVECYPIQVKFLDREV